MSNPTNEKTTRLAGYTMSATALLFGIIFIGSALSSGIVPQIKRQIHPGNATGTIVGYASHEISGSRGSGATEYNPIVRFTTSNAQQQTATIMAQQYGKDDHKPAIGSTVPLQYETTNPLNATTTSIISNWVTPIFAFLLGLLLVTVGTIKCIKTIRDSISAKRHRIA